MANSAKVHKRVYQACISCRGRRVRCDLGPVDNPHPPPCKRCRREGKECHFAPARGKKKADAITAAIAYQESDSRSEIKSEQADDALPSYSAITGITPSGISQGVHSGFPEAIVPPSVSASDWPPSTSSPRNFIAPNASSTRNYSISPTTQHSVPRSVPRSGGYSRSRSIESRTRNTQSSSAENDKAASALLRGVAYNAEDALNMLWEATRRSDRNEKPGTPGSSSQFPRSARQDGPETNHIYPYRYNPDYGLNHADDDQHPEALQDALRTWSKLRFVHSGLFSAKEALDMVKFFHSYLAPFTPVCSSQWREFTTHETLLREEPVLALTILMLASRYMTFSGPGAISRSYMIHDCLWRHLKGMLSRMIFGQEQFRNDSYYRYRNSMSMSSGPRSSRSSVISDKGDGHDDEDSRAIPSVHYRSLRTLGTCEAMLLLSEWHPRALHLSAGEDRDTLIVDDEPESPSGARPYDSKGPADGRLHFDWLEPIWRSDRMCWSMLGNALSLAVELGIFDDYDDTTLGAKEMRRDIWKHTSSKKRAYRVQRLLWVYLTQTSGRLGWKNMTAVSLEQGEPDVYLNDTVHCWVSVASLLRQGNMYLFRSRGQTEAFIKSGEYIDILDAMCPQIDGCVKDFEKASLSQPMRALLRIEFFYSKILINSVTVQAAIDLQRARQDHLMAPEVIDNLQARNNVYLTQVINGAKAILYTALQEFVPGGMMRHLPIRTYSRIISGSILCLKTAIFVTEQEKDNIVELIENVARALRENVADDVHISHRFGEVLAFCCRNFRETRERARMESESEAQNIEAHPDSSQLREDDMVEPPSVPAGPENDMASETPTYTPADLPSATEMRTSMMMQYGPHLSPQVFPDGETANTEDGNSGGGNSGAANQTPLSAEPSTLPQVAPGSLGSTSAPEPSTTMLNSNPAFMPNLLTPSSNMFGTPASQPMRQEALMNFASMGGNQLSWAGGQDVFDMLGPFIDNPSYESLHR